MIILHDDNPFSAHINHSHARSSSRVASGTTTISGNPVTVSIEKTYVAVLFSRVAQHRDLFDQLTLEGSKLFMHIALHLGYEEQKIYIKRDKVGLSKRVFSRAVLELIGFDVILPVMHKRELYWVNLAIICCGTVQRKKG